MHPATAVNEPPDRQQFRTQPTLSERYSRRAAGSSIKTPEMLVLIATRRRATLCANGEGTSRILQTINFGRTEGQFGTAKSSGAALAYKLMSMLDRNVSNHDRSDGTLILAERPLYGQLLRMQTIRRTHFMIVEIEGQESRLDAPARHLRLVNSPECFNFKPSVAV